MKNKDESKKSNVVNLFTRSPWQAKDDEQIIRLSPELDGLEMLYSNDSDPSRMFSMKILCWGLNKKGEVDAMVPWLGKLQSCRSLNDPLNGHWEGYFDNARHNIFFDAPDHKIQELTTASHYFSNTCDKYDVIQEIPDNIGTHAIFSSDNFQTMKLMQVISWKLMTSGNLLAMTADTDKITKTPVLPGDDCLYSVQQRDDFKYFFHHAIANKLKEGDESTMAAFSSLLDL